MRKLIAGAALALIAGMLGAPALAEAPPQFEDSDPENGQMVHSISEASATFNELLDPTASTLSVSACGQKVDDGNVEVSGMTVSVGIAKKPVGTYVASYSVTGIDDTPGERADPTEGTFSFSYHEAECEGDDHDGGHGDGDGDGDGDHSDHDGDGSNKNKHKGHGNGGGGPSHSEHSSTSSTDHTDHEAGSTDDGNHSDHEAKGAAGHGKRHKKMDHGDHRRRRHGEHKKDKEAGSPAPPETNDPAPPNDALNLTLALLIPALMGAVGGRALKTRTVSTAT
jgi:CopC domain